jgi:hypothetical protein
VGETRQDEQLGRVARMLRLRKGEGRLVGLLFGLMLVAQVANTVGASGISALFFERVGADSLPLAYLLLGAITFVVMLALTGALSRQRMAQERLVGASARAFELSQALRRAGQESYLIVLDAQRNYYATQQALIASRLAEQANLVTLYRVLGGGWDERSGTGEKEAAELVPVTLEELRRVFNLGIGYCAVVPEPADDLVIGRIVRQ